MLNRSTVVRKMRRLDNYAPESLFSKTKSEETVRGRTFCEIFLLPSDDFQQIVHSQCDTTRCTVADFHHTGRLDTNAAHYRLVCGASFPATRPRPSSTPPSSSSSPVKRLEPVTMARQGSSCVRMSTADAHFPIIVKLKHEKLIVCASRTIPRVEK